MSRGLVRAILAAVAAVLLLLLLRLALHTSEHPTILGRWSASHVALMAAVGATLAVAVGAQHRKLFEPLYGRSREIALLVVTVVGMLAILEGVTRLVDPLGISYFRESTRYQLDKLADPDMYFKHRPLLTRRYQGVEVATNAMGLRERPLGPKRPGELRILFLGDSVTFGWGVPVETAFPRRVESLLSESLHRPVLTVNSGVGGYNTAQEWGFLRTRGDEVAPDAVVLLYVVNDIVPNTPPFDPWSQVSLRGKSVPDAVRVLLGKSWLYRLFLFSTKKSGEAAPETLNSNDPGVKESMQGLRDIASWCRARSLPFVLFFYRESDSSHPGARTGIQEALLREVGAVGASEGFPVEDVKPFWGNVTMRGVTNSVVDAHPNAKGHELIAAGMAKALAGRLAPTTP